MARTRLVAANWKMHKTNEDAAEFAVSFKPLVSDIKDIDIVICPPFTAISTVAQIFKGTKIKVGAQDIYFEKEGAFTGEISGDMISDAGADYVIIGHSERRLKLGETDEMINRKVLSALQSGLNPILCVGETLEQKEKNKTFEVLEKQLTACLKGVSVKVAGKLILAYEPVWAISSSGTGKIADPDNVEEEHRFIRNQLEKLFNRKTAESIRILYGGSVNPLNAKMFIDQNDIDGVLVGSASLHPSDFAEVIRLSRI